VRQREGEILRESWGGGAWNMKLEGDPRLGKVMAMGENPFPGCLPAKNGHQWIRWMCNNVMLPWLQEIERKLSRGDKFELDSHEVSTMVVHGENYDSTHCDVERENNRWI
jgi:hypothetical protein